MKVCGSVFRGFVVVSSVLALMFAAGTANAATVGCTGSSGTFDFASINDALAANPSGNVTITISGTCQEAVVIANMQNVQLVGTPGAALVDPGGSPSPFGAVLEIDNSQNITVQSLTIQVAARTIDVAIPVVAISSSDVAFRSAKIEGAGASDGIDMFQSNVRLFGNTVIENNNDGAGSGEGVAVIGPSANLTLRRDSSGCPLIQNNGDNGVLVQSSGAHLGIPAFAGCGTIQNNFIGVFAIQGSTVGLNASQTTPGSVQLLNNVIGVAAVVGSHVGVSGPVLIQGNTVDGVRLRNGQGNLFPAVDGPAGPIIQQNGTAAVDLSTECCALPAGISVANNSALDISAGTVANNSAPGLLVQDNSSVRVIGSNGTLSITQNPVGISVTNVSTAALFLAASVSGNSTFDLTCGPDSVAYGDLSGVAKTSCQQFKQLANPGKPPKRANKIQP